MKIRNDMLCAILFSALASAPAYAASARTLANVNMRASPGTSYAVVNIVPRGARVKASYCISNGWCRVTWRGNRGWIAGRYLNVRNIKRRV